MVCGLEERGSEGLVADLPLGCSQADEEVDLETIIESR